MKDIMEDAYTLGRHMVAREGLLTNPVIIMARTMYYRMGFRQAVYVTFNLQYHCQNGKHKEADEIERELCLKFWGAVRAELRFINIYRSDRT